MPHLFFRIEFPKLTDTKDLLQKMFHVPNDRDERREYHHDAHCWENKEHQRKDQLDRGLGGHFLGFLAALRSQCVRESAQRLRNRGAESIGLDQHGDK